MIIEVKANLKLNKGGLMRKGRYDDAEEPFPQEVYTEIKNEEERTIKRGTILVLSGSTSSSTRDTETTLLDPGIDIVNTENVEGAEEAVSKKKGQVTRKKSGKIRTRKK